MDHDDRIRAARFDELENIDTIIRNSGADEHSIITQSDNAITPGAKHPILHLFGSAVIDPELVGDMSYLAANAIADLAIEIPDLPLSQMEYGEQLMISHLWMSNSVNGRNQDTKAKMVTGVAGGAINKLKGRWSRRGKGYEGGDSDG